MSDRWRLEWEAGLRRLPFFIQRLAVVLVAVAVAVLALLGGLAVLIRPPAGAPLRPAPEIEGSQPPAALPPATGPSHPPTPGQPRAATPGPTRPAPATTPLATPNGRTPGAPTTTSHATPTTSAGPIRQLVDRLLGRAAP